VEYRTAHRTTGPLFIGRDTHGLSELAWVSALEVLAANDVVAVVDSADRYTPTPAISHAILTYNRGRTEAPPLRLGGLCRPTAVGDCGGCGHRRVVDSMVSARA
jgi:phosphoglucomutase